MFSSTARRFVTPSFTSNARFFTTNSSPLQRINLFHLQQAHDLPKFHFTVNKAPYARKDDINKFFRAVHSQYLIAKFLATKKNPLVVAESYTTDTFDTDPAISELKKFFQMLFPKGMPNKFTDLNQHQTDWLYNVGGSSVLMYLGQLNTIYKSIGPKAHKDIDSQLAPYLDKGIPMHQLPPHIMKIILVDREYETLKSCKELALRQNKPVVDIYVQFGKGHNLQNAIANFKDKTFHYAGCYDLAPEFDQFNPQRFQDMEKFVAENNLEHLAQSDKISALDLARLYRDKPWVLKALTYYNFSSAFENNTITLTQLEQLAAEHVDQLKNKYKGLELCNEINAIIDQSKHTPRFK